MIALKHISGVAAPGYDKAGLIAAAPALTLFSDEQAALTALDLKDSSEKMEGDQVYFDVWALEYFNVDLSGNKTETIKIIF